MFLRNVIILKSFFSVDKNVTKSNFFFQKFWKDFGDYKHIKTRAMCNACPKTEHTFIGKDEKELDEKDLFV